MNYRPWVLLVLIIMAFPSWAWAEDMRLFIDARTWKNPEERQILLNVLQTATENEKNAETFFSQERFDFIQIIHVRATDNEGHEVFKLDRPIKIKVNKGKIEVESPEKNEKQPVQEHPAVTQGGKAINNINEVIPPFYTEGRSKYRYLYLGTAILDGEPVHRIQFYPVTSHPKLIKGIAYFNAQNYHLVRIEAQMVQNPPFVSEGSGVVTFAKVREDLYLSREFKVHGLFGFLFWQYHVEYSSRREGLTFSDR